ncbi:NAD(P)-binding protein [Auriculariales sp. MPI-PUGE-AT-0066]|nr:NAD(P)-binding protein [Auriculariales sp. MPI-PUGE-AT-0066]
MRREESSAVVTPGTCQSLYKTVLAANAPKSIVPVAAVVDATSGIGAAIAEVLAQRTCGRSHIVLIGRSEIVANDIIGKFPEPVNGGPVQTSYQCDVAEMRNRLNKIKYLVMSSGSFSMAGRRPTDDGVYYNLKATDKRARMSVLDSKSGGPVFMALEKAYSIRNAAYVASTYTKAAFELAKRHSTISYIHVWPGIVAPCVPTGLPFGVSTALRLLGEIAGVSSSECGENHGAYFRENKGGEVPRSSFLTQEVLQQV